MFRTLCSGTQAKQKKSAAAKVQTTFANTCFIGVAGVRKEVVEAVVSTVTVKSDDWSEVTVTEVGSMLQVAA